MPEKLGHKPPIHLTSKTGMAFFTFNFYCWQPCHLVSQLYFDFYCWQPSHLVSQLKMFVACNNQNIAKGHIEVIGVKVRCKAPGRDSWEHDFQEWWAYAKLEQIFHLTITSTLMPLGKRMLFTALQKMNNYIPWVTLHQDKMWKWYTFGISQALIIDILFF